LKLFLYHGGVERKNFFKPASEEILIQLLQLMQLTDSAIPIGAAAHSFGMETLVEWGSIDPDSLQHFIRSYLHEQGLMEACYFRAVPTVRQSQGNAVELSRRLSATRAARESREGSIALGNRLLHLCQAILPAEMWQALVSAIDTRHTHHVIVFAVACDLLGLEQEAAVTAFLQQGVAAMVSIAQRLMPLGQRQAAAVQWAMKPAILEAAGRSRHLDYRTTGSFLPLLEIASMRHPRLETRLFVS
jgi:urease accessory protein